MVNREQAIILGALGLTVVAVAIAVVLIAQVRISGTGSIRAIGVKIYGDDLLTKEISAIDWGSIDVGGSSVVTLWVKSNSTIPITLSMSTDSWQPSLAGQYLTLTWNYNGAQLLPGQSMPIDLTLQVSPDIHDVADFSFMTTIEMRST